MNTQTVKTYGKCAGRPCYGSRQDAQTVAPKPYRCKQCGMWHLPKANDQTDKGVARMTE
jgi:hypothetical protein